MRRFSRALAGIVLLVTGAISLQAQVYSVRGVISESGSFGVRPLAGATIALAPGGATAVSDASGNYVIGSVAPGTYLLRVVAQGHRSAEAAIAVASDVTLNYTLASESSASQVTLQGTVVESGSFGSRALSGATIRLIPGNHVATTNAVGHYLLQSVPSGTYTLDVTAPGHRGSSLRVTLTQNTEMNFNLVVVGYRDTVGQGQGGNHGGSGQLGVHGVVHGSDGRGIPGVSIRLTPGNYQVTTGADGGFSLGNIRAGRYMLHIKAPGYRAFNQKVTVSANRPIDITLTSTGASGSVENREADDDRDEVEEHESGSDHQAQYGKRDEHDDDDDNAAGGSHGKGHGNMKKGDGHGHGNGKGKK